jgi:hypothetical protein
MLRDEDGRELLMWPAGAVRSGDDGPVLVVGADTPEAGSLTAEDVAGLRVMARLRGTADDYRDLALEPFDLSALPAGVTQFEMFLRAEAGVEGVEHPSLNVVSARSSAANWAG